MRHTTPRRLAALYTVLLVWTEMVAARSDLFLPHVGLPSISVTIGGGSNNAPATAPATTPAPTPAPTPTPTPTPTTTPAPTPQGQQCISTAYGQMAYTQQQLQCLSSSAEASDTVQAFFAASALVGVAILGDDSSLGNLLGDQAVYAALKGRGSFKDIVKGYVDWSQQAAQACSLPCLTFPHQGDLGQMVSSRLWLATITSQSPAAGQMPGRHLLWSLKSMIGEKGAHVVSFGAGALLGWAETAGIGIGAEALVTAAVTFSAALALPTAGTAVVVGLAVVGAVALAHYATEDLEEFGDWVAEHYIKPDEDLYNTFKKGQDFGGFSRAIKDGLKAGSKMRQAGKEISELGQVQQAAQRTAKAEDDIRAAQKEVQKAMDMRSKATTKKMKDKYTTDEGHARHQVNEGKKELIEAQKQQSDVTWKAILRDKEIAPPATGVWIAKEEANNKLFKLIGEGSPAHEPEHTVAPSSIGETNPHDGSEPSPGGVAQSGSCDQVAGEYPMEAVLWIPTGNEKCTTKTRLDIAPDCTLIIRDETGPRMTLKYQPGRNDPWAGTMGEGGTSLDKADTVAWGLGCADKAGKRLGIWYYRLPTWGGKRRGDKSTPRSTGLTSGLASNKP